MRKRGGRCRVGQVVSRNVDSLNRGDRTLGGGGDPLLQGAHVGGQRRLVTHRRRNTAKQRRHFRASLSEAENVVNEEQDVLAFLVTEIFSKRQAGQGNARACTRRLVHLAVDQRGLGAFAIGLDNAGFDHLVIQVVALTGTLADTGEDRVATMRFRDVVDEFHDQNGLADTGATEQADLAALCVRREKIDDLDACHQNLCFCRLVDIFRCRAVDRVLLGRLDRLAFVDRLTDDVQDAAKGLRSDRNGNRCTGIGGVRTTNQTFGRVHGDGPYRGLTKMLCHLKNKALTVIVDLEGVLNGRKLAIERDIDNGADDLTDFADIVRHFILLRV